MPLRGRSMDAPEIRPLVGPDYDAARRRHVFHASLSGKRPKAAETACPVHFYSRSLDTLGSSSAGSSSRPSPSSIIGRSASAVMGTASTGRGEYPLPVAGSSASRSPSRASLVAAASQQALASRHGSFTSGPGRPGPLPYGTAAAAAGTASGGGGCCGAVGDGATYNLGPLQPPAATAHWHRQRLVQQRKPGRAYMVRLPHWPEGVVKRGY
eukprot:TRINITY_DN66690_c0_g1_i1.p1 TRINITY_DN66690_c0_g1~~TRINITY_DN66690_c0_g1_i1.p1  ORF type:complete len:211 (-),score=26.90 TRINITY_DN66690_c0_g1_i1:107-739(-)